MHEASLYSFNSFVTLTYDDKHLPPFGGLCYRDVQKFFKRFRKSFRGLDAGPTGSYPLRYFVTGEFGEKCHRPHYHLLLFNIWFRDCARFGENTFTSESVARLWPLGGAVIGSVTHASAAYVTRYTLDKVSGVTVNMTTGEMLQSFTQMSRKPGIGSWWYDKYRSDVLPCDYALTEDRKEKVPRFYALKYAASDPLSMEEVQHARYLKAKEMPLIERSPARRKVCEGVAAARVKHFSKERL